MNNNLQQLVRKMCLNLAENNLLMLIKIGLYKTIVNDSFKGKIKSTIEKKGN